MGKDKAPPVIVPCGGINQPACQPVNAITEQDIKDAALALPADSWTPAELSQLREILKAGVIREAQK
jgi:hypothetical protein